MPPKRRVNDEPSARHDTRLKRRARPEPAGSFQHPTPIPTPAGSTEQSTSPRVSFGQGNELFLGQTSTYSSRNSPGRHVSPRRPGGATETVHPTSKGNTSDPASQQLLSEELASTNNQRSSTRQWNGGLPSPARTSSSRSRSDPQTQHAPPAAAAYRTTAREHDRQNRASILSDYSNSSNDDNEQEQDENLCNRVHYLRARICDFALLFVSEGFPADGLLDELCENVENAQLLRYIGCLALAGPKGVQSWRDLLKDKETLKALIIGIVSTALKEHVFSALWFGATPDQEQELHNLQERQKEGDGYQRTKSRAARCKGFGAPYEHNIHAEGPFLKALETMLAPLYHRRSGRAASLSSALLWDLRRIVDLAANLSREFRLCGNAIYHWPSTFKDEEFDPDRMECLNIASMITKSPYEKKNVNGHERSVLADGSQETAEAIVQVVVFPGLVVHRKSGGALAKRLLKKEARNDRDSNLPPDVQRSRRMGPDGRERQYTGEEGFRTRVICKSVVHLIWGKQRLLTREAGTSAHLDAMRDGKEKKYEEDRKGYVELYDHFLQTNPEASRAVA